MKITACKLCGKPFVCNNGMWFTTCTCAKDRPEELKVAAEIIRLESSLKRMDEMDPDEVESTEYQATLCRLVELRESLERTV